MKTETSLDRLILDFTLLMISFCEALSKRNKRTLPQLLMRTSLSLGANVEQAMKAASTETFIEKIDLASNEAKELEVLLQDWYKPGKEPDCAEQLSKVRIVYTELNTLVAQKQTEHHFDTRLADEPVIKSVD